jgi:general secretion pathway protein I
MRVRGGNGSDRGSMLVEAMVAVAIVAMMLAVAYRAMGDSLLRVRGAEASRTAAVIAQSRLASVGSEIPLSPGETTGVDGDFTWDVTIAPAPQEASDVGRLLSVTARVRGPGDKVDRVVLPTLRVEPVS